MLQLSRVGVLFQGKPIVSGIALAIKPREIHVLMGPNGSGKSTLSLALAGHPHYQLSAQAEVKLDETNLVELMPHERARAGLFLSFQNPVAIPGVSVKQMMKMMVDHLTKTKLRVSEFMMALQEYADLVGVRSELLDRSVHDGFSGGEKKRLEMLMLLMARPKYAILDEIDSGLDVDAIKIVTKAIGIAKDTFGTGFLIVTHYRRILDYLPVDAVHVLMGGTMVLSGGKEVVDQIESRGYRGLR